MTLGILLEFGFHDIKKYIHSGLTQELTKDFNIVWFVLNKNNSSLNEYLLNTGFPIVLIQKFQLIEYKCYLDGYNQFIRRSYMLNENFGLFHNYNSVLTKSIKTKLVGRLFLKSIFEKLLLKKIDNFYNSYLSYELKRYGVDKVLFSGYSSSYIKNVVATCEKIGISSFCIINSWKDLYVNNFIPFRSSTKFMVWDKKMKEDYLSHMPYLDEKNIIVTGNPTFDYVIGSRPKYDRLYYVHKYNIPAESKWIYYTMMPPGIVQDEIETIQFIATEFYHKYGNKYIFLIRRNPNHSKNEFCEYDFSDNVRLTEHYCDFDNLNDILIQSPEGEQEWLDLLHYTSINFSIPSTVTLEFLTLRKPVCNIAFEKNNRLDKRLDQFFKAGFYQHLFAQHLVYFIKTIDDLFYCIDNMNWISNLSFEIVDKSGPKICEVLKNV